MGEIRKRNSEPLMHFPTGIPTRDLPDPHVRITVLWSCWHSEPTVLVNCVFSAPDSDYCKDNCQCLAVLPGSESSNLWVTVFSSVVSLQFLTCHLLQLSGRMFNYRLMRVADVTGSPRHCNTRHCGPCCSKSGRHLSYVAEK